MFVGTSGTLALAIAQKSLAPAGGMDDDAKFQNPKLFSQNRSMIKIGG